MMQKDGEEIWKPVDIVQQSQIKPKKLGHEPHIALG